MKRVKKGAACLSVLVVCLSMGLQYEDFWSAAEKSEKRTVYQDMMDEADPLCRPKLNTSAYDVDSGTHVSQADSDVTVINEVQYENLMPGREYTLRGTLVDQKTKKAKTDVKGNKIAAQAVFTPAKTKGSLELAFQFDGSGCAGETLVVYEELLYNGESVAEHKDTEDPRQVIYFPDAETTASGQKIGEKSIWGKGFKGADTMSISMKLLCIYVFLFMVCAGMLVKMELYSR